MPRVQKNFRAQDMGSGAVSSSKKEDVKAPETTPEQPVHEEHKKAPVKRAPKSTKAQPEVDANSGVPAQGENTDATEHKE